MHNLLKTIFVLSISFVHANAQNFKSKAKVNAVKNSGYYKIKLGSAITANAQNQFTDLRLFDDDGLEVPYLLKKDNLNTSSNSFSNFEYTQVKNENGQQIITVQNPNNLELNNLEIRMANADADRLVKISGSTNNTDWYVVKDKFYFTNSGKDNASEIYRVLEFPTTTYAYYKIEIKNKNNDPLNIKSIGQSKLSSVENNLQLVSEFKYTIKDSSDKNTYIFCTNAPANCIDKLSFKIPAPDMYLRTCTFYKNEQNNTNDDAYISASVARKKMYDRNNNSPSWQFDLNSNQKGSVYINDYLANEKIDSFTIVIANNDNAPLKIESITASQLASYSIAKLEANKNYYLYFGDSTIEMPHYDLVYFENKIPKEMEIISTGPVIDKAIKTKDEYSGTKDKYIVWIGLAIVSAILIYLTTNMMKKISAENK
jgi:hypothetical protein